MKKFGLVLSALLCALVMFGCANPANGKGADSKAEVSVSGVPDGEYKCTSYKVGDSELPGIAGQVFDVANNTLTVGNMTFTLNSDGTLKVEGLPENSEVKEMKWLYKEGLLTITGKQGSANMVATYEKQ